MVDSGCEKLHTRDSAESNQRNHESVFYEVLAFVAYEKSTKGGHHCQGDSRHRFLLGKADSAIVLVLNLTVNPTEVMGCADFGAGKRITRARQNRISRMPCASGWADVSVRHKENARRIFSTAGALLQSRERKRDHFCFFFFGRRKYKQAV